MAPGATLLQVFAHHAVLGIAEGPTTLAVGFDHDTHVPRTVAVGPVVGRETRIVRVVSKDVCRRNGPFIMLKIGRLSGHRPTFVTLPAAS